MNDNIRVRYYIEIQNHRVIRTELKHPSYQNPELSPLVTSHVKISDEGLTHWPTSLAFHHKTLFNKLINSQQNKTPSRALLGSKWIQQEQIGVG